jgi:hypothetical protein
MVVVTDDDPGKDSASESGDVAASFDWTQLAAELVKPVFAEMQAALSQLPLRLNLDAELNNLFRSLRPQLDQLSGAASQAQADLVRRLMAGLPNLADLANVVRQCWPPNWQSLTPDQVGMAVSVLRDEGIPLAWVPRPEIVAQLVGASDLVARDGILVTNMVEIAVDCREALDEVVAADLKPLADLGREAIRTLEGGMHSGAQALAGNVFDTFLRGVRRRGTIFGVPQGRFKYNKVTDRIAPVDDDTALGDYRIACVLSPVLLALENYDFDADAVPHRFRRHATAHCADPTQYTSENAVVAVMLMTSVLRQAQESGWFGFEINSRLAAGVASSSWSRCSSWSRRSTTCCSRSVIQRWSWSMSAGAPSLDSCQACSPRSSDSFFSN